MLIQLRQQVKQQGPAGLAKQQIGTLTQQMQNRQRTLPAIQFLWLSAKHASRAGMMLDEAKQRRFASPDLERVLASAIPSATTTGSGWAAELAPYQGLTKDWVESVTNLSLLGRLKYLRAPFMTQTIANTVPCSADWVEQGKPIPMSRMNFSPTDRMEIKKVSALVPFTGELLNSWTPAVAENVEDLIGRVVRFTIDKSLLDPDDLPPLAIPIVWQEVRLQG